MLYFIRFLFSVHEIENAENPVSHELKLNIQHVSKEVDFMITSL